MKHKHAMLLINGETPAIILRNRILSEGTTLEGNVLKLNAFVNHQVDCQLMSYCGQHLAYRFKHAGIAATKIIAPRSGALLAQSCALHTRLPLVMAVTQPPMTSSTDAVVYSATRPAGGQYTADTRIYISSEFLTPADRVIILDDVLSSGKMTAACIELVKQSGAKLVGCGFLIEKMYDSGRMLLPVDVMIEPVVKVRSVTDGIIEFCDESSSRRGGK